MNRFYKFLLGAILTIIVIYVIYNQLKVENDKVNDFKPYTEIVKLSFLYPKFENNQIIKHQLYTLSYSEKDEQADWVAYKLFKNSINNSIKRKDNFRKDVNVITGSATLKDYRNSGYDRGHLAPAKSMSFSDITMSESFYMSNMSPQIPSFNRGIWKKLEEEVRSWISISDSLYVVTGPVLDNPLGKIGESRVTVPRCFYKTIIRFHKEELFGIGFLLKNEKSNSSVSSFSVSIDSIEKVTGLDFFHQLDIAIQNQLESNSNYQYFLQK
ncbi:DNA/RNA non-specific endonuclease [Polaribacter uvawellassae]|uniref:DNA/RNA non-specific endonuclease n=1 Tax=Polaribacter uvawellassae TaxID=3133495 RepID=UPI00321B2F57